MIIRISKIGGPLFLAVKGIKAGIVKSFPEMEGHRVRMNLFNMNTPGFVSFVLHHGGDSMSVGFVQQLLDGNEYSYVVRVVYNGKIASDGITKVYDLFKVTPQKEIDSLKEALTRLKKMKNMNFRKEREANEQQSQDSDGEG
jgi:hypothetical protein